MDPVSKTLLLFVLCLNACTVVTRQIKLIRFQPEGVFLLDIVHGIKSQVSRGLGEIRVSTDSVSSGNVIPSI